MQLGFFTMPIHALGKDWRVSLREDREAFILADELGFVEGYVGEHTTDQAENITSCLMFISTLIDATKRIKLGTGTVNLPNVHPAAVAANVAMLDHLLDGRFILGISPGGLLSDAEVFGNLDANRNEMFLEAINQILAIWAGEAPYDIKGKYWNISTARTLMADIGQGFLGKPLQKPHPPIVVSVVAPFSKGVTEAAARGWEPISGNFLLPQWVKSHWPKYVEGCQKGGRAGRPGQLAGGKEHLRRRQRPEGPRVRDLGAEPLPAVLRLAGRQAQEERPRRAVQGLARHARRRRHPRLRRRQAGDLGLAAEGGRRAAWPSARRSATSARCSTPARTGSTRPRPALHGADGREGDARRQRRASPAAARRRSRLGQAKR